MPTRYRKKKSKSKRPYRRYRRYKRRRKPRVLLPVGGHPKSKLVKLRYCDTFDLSPGLGTTAKHLFRCNSLYDPDSTEIGHQPNNFDTWSAIYDKWTVVSSKITMTPMISTTSNVNPGIMGILMSHDGNGISDVVNVNDLYEQSLGRFCRVGIGNNNGPGNEQKLVMYFNAKKFFGVNSIVGQGEYSGDQGNPTEGAFFECYFSSIEGNDPGSVTFMVTIDYIALFSEKKIDAAS